MKSPAEIVLDSATAESLDPRHYGDHDLESLEADLLENGPVWCRLAKQPSASQLVERACGLWRTHDHMVIRGLPARRDGASCLLLAGVLFSAVRPYRGGRVVKHFRMSPWTDDLSHTMAEGYFHTDINTSPSPPAATLTQCIEPDPSAPGFGQLRVARLADLLREIAGAGEKRLERLLTRDEVVMVDEACPGGWKGRISDGKTIRFHPRTLLAGQKRHGTNPPDLEGGLARIHDMALAVSVSIDLRPGDVLVVSNVRALHQRSACTVRFRSFPRDFESRSVAVLHTLDEVR